MEQTNFHGIDWISSQWAIYHRLFKSFLNGRNKFARNNSTDNIVYKIKSFFAIVARTDLKYDIGKLTTTPGLFLIDFFMFNRFGKRLFVSNLRSALIDLNFEFTFQAVDDDFQVQLSHPA